MTVTLIVVEGDPFNGKSSPDLSCKSQAHECELEHIPLSSTSCMHVGLSCDNSVEVLSYG
jgi:hypothetical protein